MTTGFVELGGIMFLRFFDQGWNLLAAHKIIMLAENDDTIELHYEDECVNFDESDRSYKSLKEMVTQ